MWKRRNTRRDLWHTRHPFRIFCITLWIACINYNHKQTDSHLRGHGWSCVPVLYALCLDGYMMRLISAHFSPWPKAYIMCSPLALFYSSPFSLTLIYSLWLSSCSSTYHTCLNPPTLSSFCLDCPSCRYSSAYNSITIFVQMVTCSMRSTLHMLPKNCNPTYSHSWSPLPLLFSHIN